ncbi:hypothetical protein D9O40_10480 [Clostridium autoethanogenum]|uniref:Uncharacterized protein n=1 Tax=Clostridium autoethanogenum TaxID=84023 RepID=A0A3M0SZW5_9CLOT|nr:hypothetical protein [Clostridium autoethanogenum]RMD00248.1 hypothetical protein D9O40_10480 [Clostridium autoethanogenum]
MVRSFDYMEKCILIKHTCKWIFEAYGNKPVYLRSSFKDFKGDKWIYFTVDGISVMMGKPSWFKKIK